jgi:ATP-dependent helicase/nuclease subunit B
VLTCAARGVDDKPLNPSPFFEHVRRMFPDLPLEEISGEFDVRSAEHPSELIVPVLRSRVLSHSPSSLPGGVKAAFRLDEGPLASLPALAPVLAKWEQIAGESGDASLSPALAERIYGREMAISVSGLEDFAACPFKFFVGRGLRAEERKAFEVDRRERGSFQHEILKEFHRRLQAQGQRWRDVSTAEARALVCRIGNELTPAFRGGLFLTSASGRFTARTLVEALEQLIEALIGWAEQYRFDPHAVEVSFGLRESLLPAWRIDLGAGHALLLRGRIDRVDLCRAAHSDAALAVVVDYKSRGRPFDTVKLQHGLELQLLAYLGVLSHLADPQGEFKAARLVPAGVFYVPLRGAPKGGAHREEAQEDPQRLRAESYQHRGRFDGDQWEKFDQRAGSKGEQFRFAKNKDGTLSKRGNEALPGAKFQELVRQAEEFLRQYGRAIYAGDVRVAPYQLRAGEKACDFCEYQRICRFDPWTEPYRVLRPPSKPTENAALPRPL